MVTSFLRSGLSIGTAAAEFDRGLFEVFIHNGDYESIHDIDNRRCFVIGRTGAGKSASFSQLSVEESDYVIRIYPEELAFHYLTNTDVIRKLSDLGVELSPFFRALWQHILVVEVLRKRYKLHTEEDKKSLFDRLLRQSTPNRARETAIQYLDDFGSSFWEIAEIRVQEITEKFERTIADESPRIEAAVSSGSISARVGGAVGSDLTDTAETTSSKRIREKYQVIVNRMQAPRMAEVTRLIDEAVLQNPYDALYIVIDDLDREWVDGTIRVSLIKSLFDSVMELQRRIYNLKILVALRTNLFGQLGYAGSQYHQVEKIRDLMLELSWKRADLRVLVETRLSKLSIKESIDPPISLLTLLPENKTNDTGQETDPFDWILDRTLLRPRDAIVWINEILAEASGKLGVSWEELHVVAKRVSRFRLDDLRDEWMDPYVGIDQLLYCFAGQPSELKMSEFAEIIDSGAFDLVADRDFEGAGWLEKTIQPIISSDGSDRPKAWGEYYGEIVLLLWRILFMGIDIMGDGQVAYSHEEDQDPDLQRLDAACTKLVIHPAFREALRTGDWK